MSSTLITPIFYHSRAMPVENKSASKTKVGLANPYLGKVAPAVTSPNSLKGKGEIAIRKR